MTYKVSISSSNGTVIFEASTPVNESRNANYEGYSIVHLPTDLWAYRNTSGRKFGVQGKLISRTPGEAAANALNVDLIRSWVLPDFGDSGATPPIVYLSAYNNINLQRVQCVVRSYSIQFPDDVDWIFDTEHPMPVVALIGIDLDEVYSAEQITAKKWKMKLSGGGSFVYGNSGATAETGGVQGLNGVTATPTPIDLASTSGFQGIASASISDFQSTGGLLSPRFTDPNQRLQSIGNGQLLSTLGVNTSSVINEPLGQVSTISASPTLGGYDLASLQQTQQSTGSLSSLGTASSVGNGYDLAGLQQTQQSSSTNTFGRSTNFGNSVPTVVA